MAFRLTALYMGLSKNGLSLILIEIDIMVHITLGSCLKTIVLSLFHGFHADGFLQTFTKHHYKMGPP